MSNLLLVSLEKAAVRMQMNLQIGEVAAVLTSAIQGAQAQIEGVMMTSLGYQTHSRLYYLDVDAFSGIQPGGAFRLEAPSYFIRQSDSLTLTAGDGMSLENAALIPETEYFVDYEKGQILLNSKYYKDKFVRLQCSTGFKAAEVDGQGNILTPQDQAPDWLQEVIMAYVGVIFDNSQVTNRSAEASPIYRRAGQHALDSLGPHLRRRGFVFRPVM